MIKLKPITNKATWEKFVLSSDQASFLQSWNWGQFNQSLGHQIFRLGFYHHSQLKGTVLLIHKISQRGRYLECPAGPIIPWNKKTYFPAFIKHLKSLAQQINSSFIRIRPNILNTPNNQKIFRTHDFIKAPMHLHAETTRVLDITQSEDQLLKAMRKNTRYSIKKAQKMGVTVTTSTQAKDINILYQLQLEAVKRHKFIPFSQDYFLSQLQAFKDDNQIQLFKANYQNKTIAVSFIIFYGQEAVYHYSGSSSQIRKVPASYLLQWQAIKAAKNRGLKKYNFWGIAPDDKLRHRFAGVTLFKKGFGGQTINYLPAHDLPFKTSYWLTFTFEHLRKRLRGL